MQSLDSLFFVTLGPPTIHIVTLQGQRLTALVDGQRGPAAQLVVMEPTQKHIKSAHQPVVVGSHAPTRMTTSPQIDAILGNVVWPSHTFVMRHFATLTLPHPPIHPHPNPPTEGPRPIPGAVPMCYLVV